MIYEPVREARALWARTYAEQLSLTTSDLAPWLLSDGRPSALERGGIPCRLASRAPISEQPQQRPASRREPS